jgi:hypothetical protein
MNPVTGDIISERTEMVTILDRIKYDVIKYGLNLMM